MVREQEYTFAFYLVKLLNMRLQADHDIAKEKRRAALLDNNQKIYIELVQQHLEVIVDTYETLLDELFQRSGAQDDAQAVMYVVFADENFIQNILLIIKGTERLVSLKHKTGSLKGNIQDAIEKERVFLLELANFEREEAVLQNNWLEFCRIEDKMFFETKEEY